MSKALRKQGINAYDDGDIEGLSAWYNQQGIKVAPPATAHEALKNNYSFLWSKRTLRKFLSMFSDVYVFGGSGNIFDVMELFDKTFFLKIEPHIQKQRILHSLRETPLMDFDENGIVIWGSWLEQEAKKRNIPFIDATLSPNQIFDIIGK